MSDSRLFSSPRSALAAAILLCLHAANAQSAHAIGPIGGTGRSDAIGGTGRTDAIGGTGRTDAIGGTGLAKTKAIGGTGRSDAIGGTGRVVLSGPLDSVDPANKTISVLGQVLPVASLNSSVASHLVSIDGRLTSSGRVVPIRIRVLSEPYVAGATQVVLSGKVTAVDASLGVFKVGRQVVDYTALLAQPDIQIVVGQLVSVVGTQPVSEGVILGVAIKVLR